MFEELANFLFCSVLVFICLSIYLKISIIYAYIIYVIYIDIADVKLIYISISLTWCMYYMN